MATNATGVPMPMPMGPGGPPGIPPNINLLVGPLLIGYLLNWALFGALCIQVYLYMLSFPRDRPEIKALVYGLFTLEVAQTIMLGQNAYHFFGSGWGNLAALTKPGISWLAVPIFAGIISLIVQLFFCWRIWVFGRSWLLCTVITILAIVEAGCAITGGVQLKILNDFTKVTTLFPVVAAWLSISAFCDILIAVSMVVLLVRRKTTRSDSAAAFATDAVVERLVRLTVETGVITALEALIYMICFLVWQDNNIYTAPALVLAKLYSNTMMANLNARQRLGAQLSSRSHESSSLNTRSGVPSSRDGSRRQATATVGQWPTPDKSVELLPVPGRTEVMVSHEVDRSSEHDSTTKVYSEFP